MKTRNVALFVLTTTVAVLLTVLLMVATAGAQPTGQQSAEAPLQVAYPLTYQGRLTDNAGNPIANQTRKQVDKEPLSTCYLPPCLLVAA